MANPQDAMTDNILEQSYCDTKWIPFLNVTNVMEYFSNPANPFYDKHCNNEVIRMQRLDPAFLKEMKGIEFELIHAKDPILFVIRKQNRLSPNSVHPLALYYILGGHMYQAPDLWTIINSRLLTTCYHLQRSFTEIHSAVRFHTHTGYSFQMKNPQTGNVETFQPESGSSLISNREALDDAENASQFQRNNVNAIIERVTRKHAVLAQAAAAKAAAASNANQQQQQQTGPIDEPMSVDSEKIVSRS